MTEKACSSQYHKLSQAFTGPEGALLDAWDKWLYRQHTSFHVDDLSSNGWVSRVYGEPGLLSAVPQS